MLIQYDNDNCGIKGVYSPNLLKIIFSETPISVKLSLYFNSVGRYFNLFVDNDDIIRIDINKIIRDTFTNDISNFDNRIITYRFAIDIKYTSSNVTYNSDVYNWVINGTRDNYDYYLINEDNDDFLNQYDSSPKFLNDTTVSSLYFNKELEESIGDYAKNENNLYIINGGGFRDSSEGSLYSHGTDSYITDLAVRVVYKNGGVIPFSRLVSDQSTSKYIKEIPISPMDLGIESYVNDNTDYYTVSDEASDSEIHRVNIIKPNSLNDKYFRLSWINKNGVINNYNFGYNYQKSIEKNVNTFNTLDTDYNVYKKIYGTTVDEIYTITTDYMSEEESKQLESLWTSPSVKASALYLNETAYIKDKMEGNLFLDKYIILDVNKMDIQRKRNSKLIKYSIDFTISSEYRTQK